MLKTILDYKCPIPLFLTSSMKNEFTCVDETQGLEDHSFRMAQERTDKNWKNKGSASSVQRDKEKRWLMPGNSKAN